MDDINEYLEDGFVVKFCVAQHCCLVGIVPGYLKHEVVEGNIVFVIEKE